jgi:NAD+ kinase
MTATPPVSKAALLARVKLPQALEALSEAAEWLDAHGCTPILELDSARSAALDRRWPTAPRETLAQGADVVLAFGGDGTLLDAAGVVMHSGSDAPLMGVNLGRLGFLTEVDRSDLKLALGELVAGRSRIETRVMLEGRIESAGAAERERLSLNDIVVTRSALSRMTEIDIAVDGQFVCHVKADGLIVATPTGSTAYNLSAGGPIVHPSVDALVITPIAPHTLTHRPLVLPATAEIQLKPFIETQSEVIVTFDGQYGVRLDAGDVVRIRRAPRLLRLIRTTPRTYFDMLRDKLKWGHTH